MDRGPLNYDGRGIIEQKQLYLLEDCFLLGGTIVLPVQSRFKANE